MNSRKNVWSYLQDCVAQFPDKVAFSYNEETYTYLQTSQCALQLARRIDGTNSPVAVICSRNAQVPLLFLAVIASGNFYIPIDPDMPLEKMQTILDDAQPRYLLGCEENLPLLEKLNFAGEFLTLQDGQAGSGEPKLATDPAAPLYMVYTSGSTGKPKGVLKSHGAVIDFIEAYCKTFDFSSEDIIGNQTPFFFDASAKDFYLALKTGARLEIIPTAKFAMPPELIDYMNEKRISFISWVPTAYSIVAKLRTFSYVKPATLKKAFFVGEVMPMKHLNYWRTHLPQVQYVNLYGQSEIAGINCYYEVTETFENDQTLPMGKPLQNCKIYLIENGKPVTRPDVIGEIYVASDALASEYYHDREKTDAVFQTMDFGDGPMRVFKSGDLASYDQKGNLIFASRSDFQIKHMGHRIELGEIEAVSGALPYILACCCLYNSEKSRITLFCEVSENCGKTERDIQSELRGHLSSYMLPGRVVILEKLPLNPNGKIDRQKLKELL